MKEIQGKHDILYGEQTRLTLKNMSFSGVPLSGFPIYLQAAAQVKKACAIANGRAGLLPWARTEKISGACEHLIAGEYTEQFPVDVYHGGGGIGVNMNLNEVIAALAGEDIQAVDEVNLSQSTSDVCHTSLRLALLEMGERLDRALEPWIRTLEIKAQRFSQVDTIARTCLQDGMRVAASALFEGTAAALRRQRSQLLEWQPKLTAVNLGWTVIGSGTGAPESYRREVLPALREVTGRNFVWRENHYDSAQYPDDVAAFSNAVRRLAEILEKFARDLRLLSSGPETGLGELKLPKVQAGSSFFPGKVNPVIPEMMIQCAMLIGGHDSIVQNALGQGEIHLNLYEEMMGFLVMDSMEMLHRAMDTFLTNCVAGIEINAEVCEAYAASRVPLIVECKEQYGYQYLSDWIKREGIEAVVEKLKRERRLASDS